MPVGTLFRGVDCRWSMPEFPVWQRYSTTHGRTRSRPRSPPSPGELRDIADLGLWTLGPAETDANLSALAELRHQVAELELRHAHHAERLGLGTEAGATDTASHWANQTRQTKRDTKRRMELAHALDVDHEPVRDAMAAGQVSEEQAAVIVRGVEAIPVEHRRDAEAAPDRLAAEHDPVALRRLAARILEVVAPEIAEDHERKRWNGRKHSPRKPAGSPSPTTGTGCATAGSPCPPRWGRSSSRRCSP